MGHLPARWLTQPGPVSGNPADRWPNEHPVQPIPGVAWYTLVLFEGGAATGVVSFLLELEPACAPLGKRYPSQDKMLQFRRRKGWNIWDDAERFRALGLRVWVQAF